jgi:hypothetical protein
MDDANTNHDLAESEAKSTISDEERRELEAAVEKLKSTRGTSEN